MASMCRDRNCLAPVGKRGQLCARCRRDRTLAMLARVSANAIGATIGVSIAMRGRPW